MADARCVADDLYRALGVDPSASAEALLRAYQRAMAGIALLGAVTATFARLHDVAEGVVESAWFSDEAATA